MSSFWKAFKNSDFFNRIKQGKEKVPQYFLEKGFKQSNVVPLSGRITILARSVDQFSASAQFTVRLEESAKKTVFPMEANTMSATVEGVKVEPKRTQDFWTLPFGKTYTKGSTIRISMTWRAQLFANSPIPMPTFNVKECPLDFEVTVPDGYEVSFTGNFIDLKREMSMKKYLFKPTRPYYLYLFISPRWKPYFAEINGINFRVFLLNETYQYREEITKLLSSLYFEQQDVNGALPYKDYSLIEVDAPIEETKSCFGAIIVPPKSLIPFDESRARGLLSTELSKEWRFYKGTSSISLTK